MIRQAELEQAFRAACADELAAPKPGNVGMHAAGHGMTADDFLTSAAVSAPPLCASGTSLGERIFGAIAATRAAVGQNTNLGIVLLCAPLARAAEVSEPDLRAALQRVLDESDVADADSVFRAISLAAPGGLGDAPRHDVRAPATVPLGVAMAEAADRDRVARQWVTGFADVLGPGLAAYEAARARWPDPRWAPLAVYLRFLAAFPDSHIARKFGPGGGRAYPRGGRAIRASVAGRRRSTNLASGAAGVGLLAQATRHQSRHQRRPDGRHHLRRQVAQHVAIGRK